MTGQGFYGTRVEHYVHRLTAMAGGVAPRQWIVESTKPGLKGVAALGFPDTPQPGTMISVTYGLSLTEHPTWTNSKPELGMCVTSEDPSWMLVPATIGERLCGQCPFSYGDLINWGGPIAPDTQLDGFVAFAPTFISGADARIDLGDPLPVNIVQLYPTYARERDFIGQYGLQAFFSRRADFADVRRPPLV
jgi:Suppressor of fused protein (SUFU)